MQNGGRAWQSRQFSQVWSEESEVCCLEHDGVCGWSMRSAAVLAPFANTRAAGILAHSFLYVSRASRASSSSLRLERVRRQADTSIGAVVITSIYVFAEDFTGSDCDPCMYSYVYIPLL